ncbi:MULTISPECIES: SRPBCC family protein [Streptosporangium]|uniref:Carbon monoxide dehydrogenase subunit G n=1 Tax=Streptosporangium brasiliense TaxID=47480 RepID=A0ABT9R145_9ACTN|nr:SRPBCC family protein [Streptosporangium brasiliense]MDP9862949.1 carbon monoxide dehydrogenase subunit G [Streptosporangium brasiliense]
MAMRFEHEFTVPVPVEQAWSVLLDVERVAPCLPGATLDTVEGDSFTGRMKVKVGPITVTYQGEAAFEDVDKDAHALTIKAAGKETRGSGTAGATVTARLHPAGADTRVAVETSFNVTGRPAQFGRGVMAEIGGRLIDRFAANLAGLLGESPVAEPATPPLVPGQGTAEQVTDGVEGAAGTGAGATGAPGLAEPADLSAPEDAAGRAGGAGEGSGEPSRRSEPVRHLTAVPSSPEGAAVEKALGLDAHPAGAHRASRTAEEEALDLMEIAGLPLLKRAAPLLAALAGLVLAGWLVRRMLRRR